MKGLLALALGSAAALLLLPAKARARYEYARAIGKRCSTCHEGHRPGITNLNAAGVYYLTNRTLVGFGAKATGGGSTPRRRPAGERMRRGPGPGATLFARNCTPCHGAEGRGTEHAPQSLLKPHRARTPEEIAAVVRRGIENTSMFAFGEVLSEAEIRALAEHVLSLRRQGG